jgi:hypothetical protein
VLVAINLGFGLALLAEICKTSFFGEFKIFG